MKSSDSTVKSSGITSKSSGLGLLGFRRKLGPIPSVDRKSIKEDINLAIALEAVAEAKSEEIGDSLRDKKRRLGNHGECLLPCGFGG